MAKQRKRGRFQKNVAKGRDEIENEGKSDEVSGYEQFRDQRIKENMERMQKLGILDLSRKLKSESRPPKRPKKEPYEKKSSLPADPPRRSSRLQNVTRISYAEARIPKENEKEVESVEIYIQAGSEPEIYTEEHEKLLGDCKTEWTLYVDGYGEDGERIYDPFHGKSCHQCRQKTLGHRTKCSKCKTVQGQFCGDCLYMRYGENILETNGNPNWICPVCRGICNCSRCRRAKGWAPTSSIYKKVSRLGFKSVAHYLIHTRRFQTNQEEPAAEYPVSPSLSADIEADSSLHDEGLDLHIISDGIPIPQPKDNENVEEEYSDGDYNEEDDDHDESDDDSDDESEDD